jgi:hypothetical protein
MKINILNSIFNKKSHFLIDKKNSAQISLFNDFFMV